MRRSRTVEQLILFGFVAGLFVAVVHSFIIPVTMGLIISLVFRPVYSLLCRETKQRTHLAATISTLIILLCVLLPLIVLGIFVAKEADTILRNVRQASSANPNAGGVLQIPFVQKLYGSIDKIFPMSKPAFEKRLRSVLARGGEAGTNAFKAFAASVPKRTVGLLFFLISFYFGLLDGPELARFIRSNMPFSDADTTQIFTTVRNMCNAVILGTLLAGIVQGMLLGLGCWILGVPGALVFGVLTVIFSFIPLVGSAPAGISATLYLVLAGRPVAALIMLILFVIASISDNVVKPWVLKGKMELHPLLGLLSVLGGLRIFGFSGLFLGPIVTALTLVLVPIMHRKMRRQTPEQAAASAAGIEQEKH